MKSNKISTLLAILTFMFFVLAFFPGESAAKEKFEEKFEKTVSLAKDGHVILKNISGDIKVKSWNQEQVKIDALKVSKGSTLDQAKKNAEKVTIEVNKEGNILRIETKYQKVRFKSLNVSVNYSLSIPDKASIKIKSVSGDITLVEIGGRVEAGVVSGDVGIMKANKGVECKAVSGDLELQGITGDVDLKTVSGDITLENMRGSIDFETVSGDVELRAVSEAKVVKGNVLSGSIIYQGSINPDGRYNLKSHSGRVEMILPPDSAFDLEAKTFSGKVQSDFDITVSGKITKKQIQGVVNGGGAAVTLKTFSGNVYLRKK